VVPQEHRVAETARAALARIAAMQKYRLGSTK